MSELYLRSAAVTVGKPLLAGKKFAGLRIAFEIDKTSEGTPNPAKVMVYNLSPQSRAEVEAKDLLMRLDVGYLGLFPQPEVGPPLDPILSQLFVGNVARAFSVRQGPDIVTTLEAGDGEVAIKEAKLDQSFAPMTPFAQVIQTLATKLGAIVGTIAPGASDVFANGLSLTGLVSDNLDTLTKKQGLEWAVTDGKLNVLAPGQATAESAVLLNANTGLIGFPSKRQDKETGTVRVEFMSLLNPEIRPGRRVSLESQAITGVFRVRRCMYRGDTHAGDWIAAVEAV